MTAVEVATTPGWRRGMRELIVNPWGRPRFLRLVGIGFIVWTLIPIVLAILFSFNPGRSISAFQGFSLRWYVGDPVESVWHDPALRRALAQSLKLALGTVVLAVPLGVAFALGIDRWLLPHRTPERYGRRMWAATKPVRVDWATGACLLVRRADAEAVGLLDERFFMYTEDVDFCASLRARGPDRPWWRSTRPAPACPWSRSPVAAARPPGCYCPRR